MNLDEIGVAPMTPSFSDWYSTAELFEFKAQLTGLEPVNLVLKTNILPLNYSNMFKLTNQNC